MGVYFAAALLAFLLWLDRLTSHAVWMGVRPSYRYQCFGVSGNASPQRGQVRLFAATSTTSVPGPARPAPAVGYVEDLALRERPVRPLLGLAIRRRQGLRGRGLRRTQF